MFVSEEFAIYYLFIRYTIYHFLYWNFFILSVKRANSDLTICS